MKTLILGIAIILFNSCDLLSKKCIFDLINNIYKKD